MGDGQNSCGVTGSIYGSPWTSADLVCVCLVSIAFNARRKTYLTRRPMGDEEAGNPCEESLHIFPPPGPFHMRTLMHHFAVLIKLDCHIVTVGALITVLVRSEISESCIIRDKWLFTMQED